MLLLIVCCFVVLNCLLLLVVAAAAAAAAQAGKIAAGVTCSQVRHEPARLPDDSLSARARRKRARIRAP